MPPQPEGGFRLPDPILLMQMNYYLLSMIVQEHVCVTWLFISFLCAHEFTSSSFYLYEIVIYANPLSTQVQVHPTSKFLSTSM